jgi:hypothetical protein
MGWGFLSSDFLMSTLRDNLSFLLAIILYVILLVIWPLLTGVGMLQFKNWARLSIFIMSVFAIFIGISSCLSLIFFPQSLLNTPGQPRGNITEYLLSIVNFIFFIGIPVAFIIFFSGNSVKAIFVPAKAAFIKNRRPVGITLIAFLSFFTAIFWIKFMFSPNYPNSPLSPLIGGVLFSGIWEKAYFLAVALINIYICIGFLKLKKGAWFAYILFNIASIIIGIINTFATYQVTFFEIVPTIKKSYEGIPDILYKLSGIMGLLIPIAILIYVFSKRRLFLDPKNRE